MGTFTPTGALTGDINSNSNIVSSPVITNLSVTATSETSYTFPLGTRKFLIRSRKCGIIRVAYTATETNTNYLTIPIGNSYCETELRPATSFTVYLQCNKDDTLEIISWS